MRSGFVTHIFVARMSGAPMVEVDEVQAVAGRGIVGDRYFDGTSALPDHPRPVSHVTLVEKELFEDLRRSGIILEPQDTRRNIVTEGVSLSGLVGHTFLVGEVILRGVSLCEPCFRLEQATQKGVLRALVHRGGLRAQILASGTIRVGDLIQEQLADDRGAIAISREA